MIRDVVARSESRVVVRMLSRSISPVALADSLLDDSSHLISSLAPVDKYINFLKCHSALEIKSLLRNSASLVLDVLLFAISHISIYLFVHIPGICGITHVILYRELLRMLHYNPNIE